MLDKKYYISSPLNYMGGKYKLLIQILPLFPDYIDCFVDLFCGGCNVGINVEADKILYNDINNHLIGILSLFKNNNYTDLIDSFELIINNYGLSDSKINGYNYYGCNSSGGLISYNFCHSSTAYIKNLKGGEILKCIIL